MEELIITTADDFSRLIRHEAKESKETHEALGVWLGKSRRTMTSIFNGDTSIRLGDVISLANYFGFDVILKRQEKNAYSCKSEENGTI